MKFNYLDAARARNMKRRRLTLPTILEFFAGKYTAPEIDELITGLRERNTTYRKENCTRAVSMFHVEAENRPTIPNEVIWQRDQRVMLRPRTTTALLCGDPLPGESALDRKFPAF